jgi:hypothetical protein
MDETAKILLTAGLTFLSSIVIAYITTMITVQLSLRRFRSERWWERKVEVYGGLLDSLYDLQQHAASIIREQEPSDDERREFESRSKKAKAEIEKFRTIGAFVISDKVWKLVDDMQKERDNNIYERPKDFYDMVDEDEFILSRYLGKVRDQIRKELKISNS